MAIRAFLLLVFLNLKASAQVSWIGIDCGSNTRTTTNGIIWQTDETFIQTGTNHLIPSQTQTNVPLAILTTLRVFTQQNKNCYTLPAQTNASYFVRAVFFYANYDGVSRPPTFDLQIDGNKLVTVVSSSTEIRYYEILYRSKGSAISVCLARTRDDQFPFITSLEAWRIPDFMYTWMNRDLAWVNSYRYNYGSDNLILGFPGDNYYRIWEPISVPGAINTSADSGTAIYEFCNEYPPSSALLDAVQSQSETTSLFLSFGPIKTATPVYIEVYSTEMQWSSSGTRSFDVYVDGKKVFNMIPYYATCSAGLALLQAVNSNLTIELRPTRSTSLPPIISAIEIYTASDALVTSGTDQDDCKILTNKHRSTYVVSSADEEHTSASFLSAELTTVNGLTAFTGAFDQLKGWSGEPCLPADTVWQWLSCRDSDPARVTSINLTGYGLNGNLPDFSQMQALEEIDVSNNSLSGQVPEFLGQLPNLKKLNLSYNDFSGTFPSSIRNNRELAYDISGNPNLDASGKNKSSAAMNIGLAVGISLVIIVLILALALWLIRKRSNQGQNQETEPETVNGSNQGQNQETEPELGNGAGFDMKPDKQSMVPEMDLAELEELIDRHENGEGHEAHVPELSDDDYVAVGEFEADVSNDQSMVPDMDLEELDEIIRDQKERADELAGHK